MIWLHMLVGFALLAADSVPPPAPASSRSQASPHSQGSADATPAANYFAGLTLVDQDGNSVDLYRDVIADRGVLIHSFFTRCQASCPPTMSILQALQGRLGDRMDAEVRLVSISVDPEHDTPRVLHAYAQRIGVKPGWLLLTGSTEQVTAALQRIGQQVDEPGAHMDLLIAGNLRTGLWKKLHSLAPSAELVALSLEVFDDQTE